MQQKLVGLTGMYCAGKNFVARLLEARGIPTLDLDKVGHEAIERQKSAIIARFGAAIVTPDGRINRKLLGACVFGKPDELLSLEQIVHPEVNRLAKAWLERQDAQICVFNAAVLHKAEVFERLDAIILVKAPLLTRLVRAKKRDRLSWAALIRRFQSQRGFTAQYFRQRADTYDITNRGLRISALERRLETILSIIGAKQGT
ncbi:MAG: dephospho-CoA kinase [Treponema sp.]|jgi:dephospho-CoA kinase|nr:dephospho-CoA kinase [Treponema sp.]